MRIIILTEGGRKIGFGHIARCGSIYEAFIRKGIAPDFIVNGDDSVKDVLGKTKSIVFNWLKDTKKLFGIIEGSEAVIIDSYLADRALYKKISEVTKAAVYIDDNKRIRYPKGVVVNGSIYAEKLKYPDTKANDYLLGTKFLALRQEFRNAPENKIKKELKTVMITFGGDDSGNMTPRVLRLLSAEFPRLKKRVVIGRSFNSVRQIMNVADDRTEFITYPDGKKMYESMRDADIAISAAGQTLYELARLGVPTIAIAVVKNQLNNLAGWKGAGFCVSAGWCKDRYLLPNISKAIKELEDGRARARFSRAGRRCIDGRGAVRIADFIVKRLNRYETAAKDIKLRRAGKDDCKDVWLWRNNVKTRKASFRGAHIPWREHKRWFNSKIADDGARIYIAGHGSEKLGVIRFEPALGGSRVSVNLNPDFFGKGLGPEIIRLGSKKFTSELNEADQIIAEIKEDNLISQKAFARAGYKCVSKRGDRLIYMMEGSCV